MNKTLYATLAACVAAAMAVSAQPAPSAPGGTMSPHGGHGGFQAPMPFGGPGSMPGQVPGQIRPHGPTQFQGHPQGGMGPGLPMEDDFFPPEMLMRVQQTIGLTDEQRDAIRKEMQETVGKFTEFQWQQSAENEKLAALSKADAVDEEKTLAQLDALLKVENEMKRLQARTMIRIRNLLTAEQREKLREMKRGDIFRNPMNLRGSDMTPPSPWMMRDRANRGMTPPDTKEPRGFRGRGEGFGPRPPRRDEEPRDNQEAQPQ